MSIPWSWDAGRVLGVVYLILSMCVVIPILVLHHMRRTWHPMSSDPGPISVSSVLGGSVLVYWVASSAQLLMSVSAYPCVAHVLISTLVPHVIQAALCIKAAQLIIRHALTAAALTLSEYHIGRVKEPATGSGAGTAARAGAYLKDDTGNATVVRNGHGPANRTGPGTRAGGPKHTYHAESADDTTFLAGRSSGLSTSSISSNVPITTGSGSGSGSGSLSATVAYECGVPTRLVARARKLTAWLRPGRWLVLLLITCTALATADILFITLNSALRRYNSGGSEVSGSSSSDSDTDPAACNYSSAHAFQIVRGAVIAVDMLMFVGLCGAVSLSGAPADVHGHRYSLYASLVVQPIWALLYIVFPALWPTDHAWEQTWGPHLQFGACVIVFTCHVVWPLWLSSRAAAVFRDDDDPDACDSSSSSTESAPHTHTHTHTARTLGPSPSVAGPSASPSSSPVTDVSKSGPHAEIALARLNGRGSANGHGNSGNTAHVHVMDVFAADPDHTNGLYHVLSTKDGWQCWLEYAEQEFVVPLVMCYESLLWYRSLFVKAEHPHLHARQHQHQHRRQPDRHPRSNRVSITTFIEFPGHRTSLDQSPAQVPSSLSITTAPAPATATAIATATAQDHVHETGPIYTAAHHIYHTYFTPNAPFRVPLCPSTQLSIARIFTLYGAPFPSPSASPSTGAIAVALAPATVVSTRRSSPAASASASLAASPAGSPSPGSPRDHQPDNTNTNANTNHDNNHSNSPHNGHMYHASADAPNLGLVSHSNSYRHLPHRITHTQLMSLFDDAIKDVWRQMDGAVFARFRCTRSYRVLCLRGHELHRAPLVETEAETETDPSHQSLLQHVAALNSHNSLHPSPAQAQAEAGRAARSPGKKAPAPVPAPAPARRTNQDNHDHHHNHTGMNGRCRPRAVSVDPPGVRHGSLQTDTLPSPMQLQAELNQDSNSTAAGAETGTTAATATGARTSVADATVHVHMSRVSPAAASVGGAGAGAGVGWSSAIYPATIIHIAPPAPANGTGAGATHVYSQSATSPYPYPTTSRYQPSWASAPVMLPTRHITYGRATTTQTPSMPYFRPTRGISASASASAFASHTAASRSRSHSSCHSRSASASRSRSLSSSRSRSRSRSRSGSHNESHPVVSYDGYGYRVSAPPASAAVGAETDTDANTAPHSRTHTTTRTQSHVSEHGDADTPTYAYTYVDTTGTCSTAPTPTTTTPAAAFGSATASCSRSRSRSGSLSRSRPGCRSRSRSRSRSPSPSPAVSRVHSDNHNHNTYDQLFTNQQYEPPVKSHTPNTHQPHVHHTHAHSLTHSHTPSHTHAHTHADTVTPHRQQPTQARPHAHQSEAAAPQRKRTGSGAAPVAPPPPPPPHIPPSPVMEESVMSAQPDVTTRVDVDGAEVGTGAHVTGAGASAGAEAVTCDGDDYPLVATSYPLHDNVELLLLAGMDSDRSGSGGGTVRARGSKSNPAPQPPPPPSPPSPHTILRHHDLPAYSVPTPSHASLYACSSLYGGAKLGRYSHPTVFSLLERCNQLNSINITDCDVSDRWTIPDTQYA